MSTIVIADIKKLRTMTGCGMMDCKKALTETQGDLEQAVIWLRKNGMAKAAKKADRETLEGAVGVVTDGTWGAVVQVASETDFVARNERFQELMVALLDTAKRHHVMDKESLLQALMPDERTVETALAEAVGVVGESLRLIDVKALQVSSGVIGTYVHNAYTPVMGKVGVITAIEASAATSDIQDLAGRLAMQVVATNPASADRESLDTAFVEKERALYTEEARASGKPEAAIEKIVEGRMAKLLKTIVLTEQPFIMDENKTVAQVTADHEATLKGFSKLQTGA